MAKHYHIHTGLRGCYLPDETYTAATLRTAQVLARGEAAQLREAGYKVIGRGDGRGYYAGWRDGNGYHYGVTIDGPCTDTCDTEGE